MRKKILFMLMFSLAITNLSSAQKYFKPTNKGIVSAKTDKKFHLVELEGKDSVQIYNALMGMVKEVFNGSEDKILETNKGSSIKVYGFSRRAIEKLYDIKFELEFKIKNNKYIFYFSKFNIETNESKTGKTKRILIKSGSNFARPDDYTYYLLNKKEKPTLATKRTYKDLIKYLDFMGKTFDITKTFNKYKNSNIEESEEW